MLQSGSYISAVTIIVLSDRYLSLTQDIHCLGRHFAYGNVVTHISPHDESTRALRASVRDARVPRSDSVPKQTWSRNAPIFCDEAGNILHSEEEEQDGRGYHVRAADRRVLH